MKILVITQKVNENDATLGFFCNWLSKLAKIIGKVYVLALEKQNTDLTGNIELYSLGKENGSNRLSRFLKFNQVLAGLCLNKKIDIIFIHMCPEYALLVFPYAKIKRIPMVMWYAHGNINMYLWLAHLLVNRVVSSSKDGFRINSKKLRIVDQGIDVDKFNTETPNIKPQSKKKIILSVGRISPIKDYETLIRAADILINHKDIQDLKFQIVGAAPLNSQKRYLGLLRNMVMEYKLESYVQFVGPIPYTQIQNYYQNCDLFVSTSNTGSLDKAVLEAMVCGKLVITSNGAFRETLLPYANILIFERKNFRQLADNIAYLLGMDERMRDKIIKGLRDEVYQTHNLNNLADKMVGVFKEVV